MSSLLDAARPRILVVEDDADVLDLITTRLDLAGYHTFWARDGRQGLARLAEVRPVAMVLDINMPALDGFGVLRKMRNDGRYPQVPTLMLTARNHASDVQEALSLGALDFLAKPFQDRQLLSRVARLLRVRPPRRDPDPTAYI